MVRTLEHLLAVMILACAVSLVPGTIQAASGPGMYKAAKQGPPTVAEPLERKDVDPFMASLTDSQARLLLHGMLVSRTVQEKESRGERQKGGFLLELFVSLEKSVRAGFDQHAQLYAKAGQELSGGAIMTHLTGGGGAQDLLRSLVLLAVVCAGGFTAYAAVGRLNDALMRRSAHGPKTPNLGRMGMILSNIVQRLFCVAAFFLAGFALFVVLIPASGETRAMGLIIVVTMAYFTMVQAFSQVLLSPGCEAARLIPVKDEDSKTLYRWLMAVAVPSALVAMASLILKQVGNAPALGHLIYALAGPVVGFILSAMILANRVRVAAAILGGNDPDSSDTRSLAARYWHYPAIAYALAIGVLWSAQALAGDVTILSLVLSLFLIPCCIGVDLWVGKLLVIASGQDREIINLDDDARQEQDALHKGANGSQDKRTIRYYIPLIRKSLRGVLVVFTAFAMLKTWGVEIPLGWLFARNVLSVLLVVVGGLLLWEVVRIRIDRRLSEETSLPGEETEEGGGAGGSRSATLLMLLRKFLLCVIVVMGSLIALSSLGVDIGPLIAGAGVVGLAIGFGAQTLVKDIISGVFFLIDDAFRVGDYVEAGTAKGTVEQISLRSMKLRHPRGMVFTIPYGGLKILQNFSRDYIISKLDFRVRLDADIEKIRKIIKRINKELMANEEISQGMLSDIKSMGVRKMEDSAMILRIKFKTIPGHQFLVEKELYRRVQEAFRKNGIEFAHRNVTVYFPPELRPLAEGEKQFDSAAQQALGAAAAEVLAEEEERIAAKASQKTAKDD
ncbi:MAG: mechanosensitive ion channel family protein [Desulfovibrio sp.]|nr:mechanosensitive ion channel family protein [Desulfovibrio sp.]